MENILGIVIPVFGLIFIFILLPSFLCLGESRAAAERKDLYEKKINKKIKEELEIFCLCCGARMESKYCTYCGEEMTKEEYSGVVLAKPWNEDSLYEIRKKAKDKKHYGKLHHKTRFV